MSCYTRNVWVKSLSDAKKVQKVFFKCLTTCKTKYAAEKDGFKPSLKEGYEPSDFETTVYSLWESKNYFKPSKSEAESFLVLLPPPNVTGNLHLGHALTCTLQDIIVRWKRMKGESVLWIPGIDHAGIATQVAVERYLKQTLGLSRKNFEKEEFVERIWSWKNEKADTIIKQLRKMGASLDWSKLMFTLDSSHSELVTKAFIQLYKDGLIYRKGSLINWSCSLKSAISDIEVDWVKINKKTNFNVPGYDKPVLFGCIYDFAYKVCNEDNEIVVSTTRPETMLGDVAVAIHPDHPDASRLKEKYVWHPFRNEKIPIIVDDFVNTEFRTGAVKITPSHSLIDFEVGVRHNLKHIQVINEEGFVSKIGPEKFHGLKRFDARWAVIKELKNLNLFRGSESHSMNVPVCSRSGDIIELILKEQWFLKCDSLVEKTLNAVKNGELKIKPKSFENVWYHWLETKPTKDWNLSRQLWWGQQIPMYKCQHKEKTIWLPCLTLEEAKIEASQNLGAPADEISVTQDPDVLDTWFSSGLLPLNGAINQERKPPISLMVTGHDILFFWLARMIMLSLHLKGELPFKEILLHGLICDTEGKKMSKSLGNVINPDDVINGISLSDMENRLKKSFELGQISKENLTKALASQKAKFPTGIPTCGTDALRFTLSSSCSQSDYLKFDVAECISNRHFCNKIFQGMKYFYKIIDGYREVTDDFDLEDIRAEKKNLNIFDNWILSKLAALVEFVESTLNSYRFSFAADAIRIFMIKDFCNFYLTSTKSFLKEASPTQFRTTVSVFFHCQETSLRLLSPFMPFLTEGLYQALPLLNGYNKCESVTVAKYPDPADWREFRDENLESRFEKVSDLLTRLRKVKSWLNLKNEHSNVYVKCPDEFVELLFGDLGYVFRNMGSTKSFIRVESLEKKNVIRQKVDEDFIALIEHTASIFQNSLVTSVHVWILVQACFLYWFSKKTLQSLFGSTINQEEKLNEDLEELIKRTKEPMTQGEKLSYTKRILNLNLQLEKIEDLKLALNSCHL